MIVVDNDSSDDSVPYLRVHHPEVIPVEIDENPGFSAGNNRSGTATDDSDYLWFLNTDARVKLYSLSKLIEYLEASLPVLKTNKMDSQRIQSLGFHYDVSGRAYCKHRGRQSLRLSALTSGLRDRCHCPRITTSGR